MTQEEVNSLFKKQNLITTLSYTLIGLSLIKDRYKVYENDSGCEGYRLLCSIKDTEQLTQQLIAEIIKNQ